MLDIAQERLRDAGYAPYYLYKQKFMSGGFENVGWAKEGYINLYNIFIMEELCKPIGSDERNGKVTYVTLHGLEESANEVEKLSNEALTLLHTLPGDNPFLEELVKSMITRKK